MTLRIPLLGGLLLAGVAGCTSNADTSASAPVSKLEKPSTQSTPGGDGPDAAAPDTTHKGGIPVVVFHQICVAACTEADTYGVSQDQFDRILTMFEGRGYRSIPMADFARAHAGDRTGLPDKPLLITFDDGRQDAYVGADPILAKHGMQATMFVITNDPSANPTYYMSWPEIQEAAASRRWTMQLHAHAGHTEMPVAADANGKPVLGAFYANLACEGGPACSSYETHDAWRVRAESDVEAGDAILAGKLGDLYQSHAFAVPFSDYGQNHTNDHRIPDELRAYFDARFAVWFTQQSSDPPFMTPGQETHEVERLLITNKLVAEDLDSWLEAHEAP